MNWLVASYQPTTFFSLKTSWATSSGGKSLLLPTPYAIKMALLDAAIRHDGLERGRAAWPWLRDLDIAVRLPPQIVVNNLFKRILRTRRGTAPPGAPDAGPFQRTIAYREYVYYPTPLDVAFAREGGKLPVILTTWLLQINYLGKRGSFMQLLAPPAMSSNETDFIRLTDTPETIDPEGLIQQVDDCGPRLTFERVNVYNDKSISMGSPTGRLVRHIVIPYRLARSSRAYSLYERIE